MTHDVNTMIAEAERRMAAGLLMTGLFVVPQSRATQEVGESLLLIWSSSEAEEWVPAGSGPFLFPPLSQRNGKLAPLAAMNPAVPAGEVV